MTQDRRPTRAGLLVLLNVAGSLLFLALAAGAVMELRSPASATPAASSTPVQPPGTIATRPPMATPAGEPPVSTTTPTSSTPTEPDQPRPAVHRTPAEVLPIEINPRTRQDVTESDRVDWPAFSDWDLVLLGRFLAIDDLVDEYARYYGNDYLWQFAAYCSESTLNPIAKGTDPGDRGLGQVGDESGAVAAEWASDPDNPYYLARFDDTRSTWDPETNIVLSSVILRSFYAMPGVADNETAYALLTYGLAARDESGTITPLARARVARAASFLDRLTAYTQLEAAYGASLPVGEGRFQDTAVTDNAIAAGLLALDQSLDDGQPMYEALRAFYLDQAAASDDPWTKATFVGEASTLDRLLVHVYEERDPQAEEQVATAVEDLVALVSASSDARLVEYVGRIQAEQGLPPGP